MLLIGDSVVVERDVEIISAVDDASVSWIVLATDVSDV